MTYMGYCSLLLLLLGHLPDPTSDLLSPHTLMGSLESQSSRSAQIGSGDWLFEDVPELWLPRYTVTAMQQQR